MRRDAQRPYLAAGLAIAIAGCGDALISDSLTGGVDGAVTASIDAAPPGPDAAVPIPDAAPDAAPPCTGGDAQATGANGNCYLLFTTPASWQSAADVCAQQVPAAHLATLTDAVEDQLVMDLAGAQDAWVGGNDLAVGGSWVWLTGEPMTYQHWGSGEPNNGGGYYEEDCMIVRKLGTSSDPTFNVETWDDRSCSNLYAFVCERE